MRSLKRATQQQALQFHQADQLVGQAGQVGIKEFPAFAAQQIQVWIDLAE